MYANGVLGEVLNDQFYKLNFENIKLTSLEIMLTTTTTPLEKPI